MTPLRPSVTESAPAAWPQFAVDDQTAEVRRDEILRVDPCGKCILPVECKP